MQRNFKKIRVILAVIFFLSIIVAFSDIKGNIPSGYYTTLFYFQFIPSLLKFLTPGAILSIGFIIVLIITLFGGRVYCSVLCPLGILQDIVNFLRRKISPRKRLRFKPALTILRYVIMGITVISLFFSGILFLNILDPYANFGRMGAHLYGPVLLAANNTIARIIPVTGLQVFEGHPVQWASFFFAMGMFLLVALLSWFRGRLYCNSICPVGTFLGLISKIALFKININQSACIKCGKCQAVCKANCIDIKKMKVDESRCIDCYDCIPVCRDNAIGYHSSLTFGKKEKIAIANGTSQTNAGRRMFLFATTGFLVSKALPAFPQNSKKADEENHSMDYFDRGPVAPPGAISIVHLKDRCVACHLCVASCPTKVLTPNFLGYGFTGMNLPSMNYDVSFCNYECNKCGEVCPTGAIAKLPVAEKKRTQIGRVHFQFDYCVVNTEGTACGSCSEHCPTQAVQMVPYKNGLTKPQTNPDICIGCGACEYACPVIAPHPAIFVIPNAVQGRAKNPSSQKIKYKQSEAFPF